MTEQQLHSPTVPPKGEPLVQVRALNKSYGATQAVKELNFEIFPGEIFGLIGPDGAGKTTSFHILGGILEQTSGEVLVLGKKPRNARLEIGYLTQQFSLYLDLSIEENIRYIGGLREVNEADFLERKEKYLKLMDLDRFSERLAGQLSGGMKQKLALCCALVARPKLLLLDEPTTGVDPVSRREFWDLLATITKEGVTVAVATPYLDEAERCSRLILMHNGAVQDTGSPEELKERLKLHRLEVRSDSLESISSHLISTPTQSVSDVQRFGDRLDVLTGDVVVAEAVLREFARENAIKDLHIERQEPTLENVFVNRLRSSESQAIDKPFPFNGSTVLEAQIAEPAGAIYAKDVSKNFGSFQAVKGVSLSVAYGQIYGLLGANGAGKTTTIKMLCGLIAPSGGDMMLCGERGNLRSEKLRRRLGYMSQKFTLYDDLTIIENLEFYCGVYCVSPRYRKQRIDWVLENTGLLGQEKMITGRLPGGWKQRLSFGAAVMHQPEVLFLDEPTSGVDPLARREMWKLIREFANKGTAVLVTTHFLEEAEHCSKLGFMVAGEVVAEGSPSSIKSAQPGQLLELRFDDNQSAYDLLKQHFESWRVSMFADSVHLVLESPELDKQKALAATEASGLQCSAQRQIPFSLEDAFIGIVKRTSANEEVKV